MSLWLDENDNVGRGGAQMAPIWWALSISLPLFFLFWWFWWLSWVTKGGTSDSFFYGWLLMQGWHQVAVIPMRTSYVWREYPCGTSHCLWLWDEILVGAQIENLKSLLVFNVLLKNLTIIRVEHTIELITSNKVWLNIRLITCKTYKVQHFWIEI